LFRNVYGTEQEARALKGLEEALKRKDLLAEREQPNLG
jgi:hypothetical protein